MPDAPPVSVEHLPRAFLGTLALALTGYAKERFEPGNNDWPATAWPRLAELLDDLQDGVVRPRTLQREHQTGVGTGRMRDSIHAEPTQDGVSIVIGGPEVDYAERFHTGGEHTLPVPQRELRRWYRTREGKAFIKEHQLGWLFHRESVTFRTQPRSLVEADGIRDVVMEEAREFFGRDAEVTA